MKNGRFEIGDIVVGTEEASEHYSITTKGWIGKVVGFVDDNEDYGLKTYRSTIILRGLDDSEDFSGYDVCHKYFDLYDPKPCLIIKGQKLPECCGVCFAYDNSGCKFGVEPSDKEVWVCRASNCPMSEREE